MPIRARRRRSKRSCVGTRQQLAERQLREGRPVAGIAEMLGFADESAFAKAFRRWAGESPARYRGRSRAIASSD